MNKYIHLRMAHIRLCVCVPDGKPNNVVGYTRCSAYGANDKDGYIRR